MMTNNTHQVADFDSIVEYGLAREIMTSLSLMPSEWSISDDEQRRIRHRGIKIQADHNLNDPNWPAFENYGVVTFSVDAFVSGKLTRDQLIAILLHEVGHRVNPLPDMEAMIAELSKIGAVQTTKPANRDELYADDYVRYCGYSNHLGSGLRKLSEFRESFQIQSIRERISRIDVDVQPLLLNLVPLPN